MENENQIDFKNIWGIMIFLVVSAQPSFDTSGIQLTYESSSFSAFLTFVNCASVKVACKIQNVFAVIKTVALIVIIITGVVALFQGKNTK